jgi:hypothetical protein
MEGEDGSAVGSARAADASATGPSVAVGLMESAHGEMHRALPPTSLFDLHPTFLGVTDGSGPRKTPTARFFAAKTDEELLSSLPPPSISFLPRSAKTRVTVVHPSSHSRATKTASESTRVRGAPGEEEGAWVHIELPSKPHGEPHGEPSGTKPAMRRGSNVVLLLPGRYVGDGV